MGMFKYLLCLILMMPMNKDKKEFERLKRKIVPILRKSGVKKAGIFGSYARGDQSKRSDIDILIEVKGRKFSLFDLVALENKLKDSLEMDVDLITYNGISPLLRERILREEVKIL